MKKFIRVIIIGLFLLCSCSKSDNVQGSENLRGHLKNVEHFDIGSKVKGFVDHDHNVICYVYFDKFLGYGGIDCLPYGK